jgi:monofunctional glycosyltransferase
VNPRRFPLRGLARALLIAALSLLCVLAGLILLYSFVPPVSTLMLARALEGKPYERIYVRLAEIAPVAVASVIVSEDATFCHNPGVDWAALERVLNKAGGPTRGASTITMQTAKNLFLWPGRSSVRKALEIGVALALGAAWSKARTMEVYLNVAEWGDGVFGIEMASRRYFHKKASQLDGVEAALLATSLPNPIKRDAAHPNALQRRLAAGLLAKVNDGEDRTGCMRR